MFQNNPARHTRASGTHKRNLDESNNSSCACKLYIQGRCITDALTRWQSNNMQKHNNHLTHNNYIVRSKLLPLLPLWNKRGSLGHRIVLIRRDRNVRGRAAWHRCSGSEETSGDESGRSGMSIHVGAGSDSEVLKVGRKMWSM